MIQRARRALLLIMLRRYVDACFAVGDGDGFVCGRRSAAVPRDGDERTGWKYLDDDERAGLELPIPDESDH